MGAEGGVVWVTLKPDGDRDEVLHLLELVGIFPTTRNGRRAVQEWMSGEGPEEIGLTDNDIVGEWNTCLPWLDLCELKPVYQEMSEIESGDFADNYVGLGPDSTLRDILIEDLTSSLGQNYHSKTILEGFQEVQWQRNILSDSEYEMTVRGWCEGIRRNLVFAPTHYNSNRFEPLVLDYEVWT